MSVVEAQPISVNGDGWWRGQGTMNVLLCTTV